MQCNWYRPVLEKDIDDVSGKYYTIYCLVIYLPTAIGLKSRTAFRGEIL
jgi:hypothetical protein